MIFSRTSGWIGVDIGTDSIKLAQVERRGSRVELVEALTVPRQQAWTDGDVNAGDIASGTEIQAGLKLGSRFRGRDAAVTLPMSVCDVRSCKVEGKTEVERREAVMEELHSVYNEQLSEREVDYWPIQDTAANGGVRNAGPRNSGGKNHGAKDAGDKDAGGDNIITFSVATAWADRVASDMRDSGLTGHVLDGLPTAMARAVELAFPNTSENIAAVDWGNRRSTLCCVRRGKPLFVRCLRDCNVQSLAADVSRALGVTGGEARKLLREHGLPAHDHSVADDVQQVLAHATRDSLGVFVEELTRTMSYLAFQKREIAPSRIVLFGGGAATKNIAEHLTEHFETPISVWRLHAAARKRSPTEGIPEQLYGPAVALSSLAWSAAST